MYLPPSFASSAYTLWPPITSPSLQAENTRAVRRLARKYPDPSKPPHNRTANNDGRISLPNVAYANKQSAFGLPVYRTPPAATFPCVILSSVGCGVRLGGFPLRLRHVRHPPSERIWKMGPWSGFCLTFHTFLSAARSVSPCQHDQSLLIQRPCVSGSSGVGT